MDGPKLPPHPDKSHHMALWSMFRPTSHDDVMAFWKPRALGVPDTDPFRPSPPRKVKEALQDFMMETSVHGCKHILRRRHWVCASVFWAVLVVGMAGLLAYVLIQLFVTYREYPFKTTWSVRKERDVTLPAFTFCLPGKVDMKRLDNESIMFDYISKSKSLLSFRSYFGSDQDMNEYLNRTKGYLRQYSAARLENEAGFYAREVFLHGTDKNGDVIDLSDGGPWVRVSPHPSQACWTFNWNHSREVKLTSLDRMYFLFNVKSNRFPPKVFYSGIDFHVHDGSYSPFGSHNFLLQPGTYAHVYFWRVEHRYLPLPYKSFGEQGCIQGDSPEFRKPPDLGTRYSQMICIMKRILRRIVAKCRCIEPHFLYLFPNASVPVCSVWDIDFCVMTVYVEEFKPLTRNEETKCPKECSYASYEVSMSTASFPTESLNLLFKSTDTKMISDKAEETMVYLSFQPLESTTSIIEHVPEVTLLNIFGTVGGYMGLFLGAGILTLAEVLETIVICLWVGMSRVKAAFMP